MNAALALAVAHRVFGVDLDDRRRGGRRGAAGALAPGAARPTPGGVTVLNDAYNANPTSMDAALVALARTSTDGPAHRRARRHARARRPQRRRAPRGRCAARASFGSTSLDRRRRRRRARSQPRRPGSLPTCVQHADAADGARPAASDGANRATRCSEGQPRGRPRARRRGRTLRATGRARDRDADGRGRGVPRHGLRHAAADRAAPQARHRAADPRRRPDRAPARGEGRHADDGRPRDRGRGRRRLPRRARPAQERRVLELGLDAARVDRRASRSSAGSTTTSVCAPGGTSACASGARRSASSSWPRLFAWLAVDFVHVSTHLSFTRPLDLDLGTVGWFVWAILVVYATANAVNLTDGLDGLAAGSSAFMFAAFMIIAFTEFRHPTIYGLQLGSGTAQAQDQAIVAAAMFGACAGFLWWNAAPGAHHHGRHRFARDRRRDGRARAAHAHRAAPPDPRRAPGDRDAVGDRAGGLVPRLPPPGAAHGADPPPLRGRRLVGVHRDRALLAVRRHLRRARRSASSTPTSCTSSDRGSSDARARDRPGRDRASRSTPPPARRRLGRHRRRGRARRRRRVRRARRRWSRRIGCARRRAARRRDDARARSTTADLVVPSPLVRVGPSGARRRPGGAACPCAARSTSRASAPACPIVAVTGTNGKTTVTTLIAAMLDASGRRAIAAGNIGRPLIDAVDDDGRRARRRGLVVPARVLADVPSARRGRARDHARPPRLARELRAVRRRQGAHHRAPARRRPARVRRRRRGRVRDRGARRRASCRLLASRRRGRLRTRGRRRRSSTADGTRAAPRSRRCGARSLHDRTNALAAAAAALEVGATPAGVRDALARLRDPPHRVALVGEAIWGALVRRLEGDEPRRDAARGRVVRFGGAARGRPQQGSRPLGARREPPTGCGGSSRSARPGPRSPPRSRDPVPVGDCRFDARRGARRRRARSSRATRCCCRPRARRSTRTPNYAERGDDFAARSPHVSADRWSARHDDRDHPPRFVGRAAIGDSHIAPGARRRRAPSRARCRGPPSYVVLCATVAVLNIVGLVMILSRVVGRGAERLRLVVVLLRPSADVGGRSAWSRSSSRRRIDYHRWRRCAPCVLVVALIGAASSCSCPASASRSTARGAGSGSGTFRVQPSEIAKLALLLCGADVLAAPRRPARRLAGVAPGARRCSAVLGALVMMEPDLDSTIVLALIGFSLLIVGGVRRQAPRDARRRPRSASSRVLAFAAPYRRARMFAFLHPWHDAGNTGYQIAAVADRARQRRRRTASGSARAAPSGCSSPTRTPTSSSRSSARSSVSSDASWCSRCSPAFGLVGFRVARRAPDPFGMLLAAGVTAWIVGQAAINLGAVVGMLPVSGITLPFLSAGGSSLVITMFGAGILANVARQTPPDTARTPRRRVAGASDASRVTEPGLRAARRAAARAATRIRRSPSRRSSCAAGTARTCGSSGASAGSRAGVVPDAGFAIDLLPGRGLQRRLTLRERRRDLGRARRVRARVRASCGGTGRVSSSASAATRRCRAWSRRVLLPGPDVVHEQDAAPGLANRIGVRLGARAAVSLPGHAAARTRRSPATRCVRRSSASTARGPSATPRCSPSSAARRVRAPINRADARLLRPLARPHRSRRCTTCAVPATSTSARRRSRRSAGARRRAARTSSSAYEEHMDDLLARATLAVCRSGAGTVAELTVVGVPAVLVPLPGAPSDHQTRNAQTLEPTPARRWWCATTECDPARLDRRRRRAARASPTGSSGWARPRAGSAGPTPRRGSPISWRSTPVAADATLPTGPEISVPPLDLTRPRRVHIVGVGGVGMSAIALAARPAWVTR